MGKNLVEIIVTAEDKASSVLQGISGGFKNLGAIALGGIGVATGAIAGITAGVISLASSAAPVAGLQQGFEALTASMQGGSAAMLSALQDASGGLVTNTDLMQSFNQAASLVSKDFAEQLPNAMGYLSKVSASTGQNMNFMLDSLVKGVGRLSPMILDNLGIQVNLTEANEIYAKSVGKSVDELTKAEQQTALMNQVMEKLAENTEGMEGLSNPFEKFKVTIANLKDEIGLKLLPVVAPLMERFGGLAQRVAPMLASAFERIITGAEPIVGILDAIAVAVGQFIDAIGRGESPLDALINAIMRFGVEMGVPSAKLVEIRTAIETFIEKVTEGKDRIMEFVGPIVESITQFVSWKDVLIAAAIGIGAIVIPAIIGIVTSLAPLLLGIAAVIAVVAVLRNAWENNWGGIQEKTQAVIDFIKPLIQNALAAIRAWWDENGAAIIAAVQNAWTTIQTAIQTIITVIQTVIQTALATIRDWWSQHGEAIVTTADKAWGLIRDVINAMVEQIKQIVAAFQLAFEGDWRGFGAKLREIWETAWRTIVNFLNGLWDMVRPKVVELWERLKAWFQNTDWKALGVSIVQGIIDGINSMIQNALSAAASIGSAIQDVISGFIGGGPAGRSGRSARVGAPLPTSIGGRAAIGAVGSSSSVAIYIDARGAARGVDADIRRALDMAMREYGIAAETRIRAGGR